MPYSFEGDGTMENKANMNFTRSGMEKNLFSNRSLFLLNLRVQEILAKDIFFKIGQFAVIK